MILDNRETTWRAQVVSIHDSLENLVKRPTNRHARRHWTEQPDIICVCAVVSLPTDAVTFIVINASLYRRDYPCRWWEPLNPHHPTPSVKLFKLITIKGYSMTQRVRRVSWHRRLQSFSISAGWQWRMRCTHLCGTRLNFRWGIPCAETDAVKLVADIWFCRVRPPIRDHSNCYAQVLIWEMYNSAWLSGYLSELSEMQKTYSGWVSLRMAWRAREWVFFFPLPYNRLWYSVDINNYVILPSSG